MVSRQQKRAQARSMAKDESTSRVYITIPEEFTDCLGKPWSTQMQDGSTQAVTFLDALLGMVRRCPVQSAEDSERALEIIQGIRATENGFIDMRRADYDWMMTQFTAHGHKLLSGADAAHFRRVIKAGTSATRPVVQEGEDSA